MIIDFSNTRQMEGLLDEINPVKELIETKINLSQIVGHEKRVILALNKVMRICFIVGLNQTDRRELEDFQDIQLSTSSTRIVPSFFTLNNLAPLYSALLKIRYNHLNIDWTQNATLSRIIAGEMLRGRDHLLQENNLDNFLFATNMRTRTSTDIPALKLLIGNYGDEEMEATLDINSRAVTNAQIIIAGATGSGKTNLLAVLMQQMRALSSESPYPVNFLLFDYKGELSDPANASWLSKFDTDSSAILDPIKKPLPFTPFKDFTGKTINEINLYSTSLASALCAIASAKISANMDNRLSEAIINAYKANKMRPITFKKIFDQYNQLLPEKRQEDMDSVKSVLNMLIQNNIFAEEDKVDLIKTCNIINLGRFEKNGTIAKAIVYFVISKLNNLYDELPKQAMNDERVEIRHFTIIDEAHYMLDFENKPLQNLIAVGRNKGMSIILATQNMEDFKSKSFDFYANAQYPLIMKQQQQNDSVLKDLFGVSGNQLQELKQAITNLQKGELITKDNMAAELGLGNHWKKIKVTHLI